MNYRDYFIPWAKDVNKTLQKILNKKEKEGKAISTTAQSLWKNLAIFIEGGKRMRAGLVKLGYESAGGKIPDNLLPVSAAIEITQSAILIHDDIIDQDVLRHNRPTVHKVYEAFHKKNYKKNDPAHYGQAMATLVGDAGFYETIFQIAQANFPEKDKIEAIKMLCDNMINTCYGEALDVELGQKQKITQKEVTAINTLKTAHYTIIGPLKIGAILAGARNSQLKTFEDYGLPLGLAFQIQDDILGLFGSEEKFGKSTTSDIREGKNTLLYTEAVKRANKKQKGVLQKLWGKKDITKKEADKVRQIIKDTGALSYNQKIAKAYVEKAKRIVYKITKNKHLQEVYLTLADFVVNREK